MKGRLLQSNNIGGLVNVSPSILSSLPKSLTIDKLKAKTVPTSYLDYPAWCSEHLHLSWDFQNPDRSEPVWLMKSLIIFNIEIVYNLL